MKLNRLLHKRRHPAAAFVSDHGMLLAGIAGSAALAFAANRMRGKARPQFIDRAMEKSRDLGNRARGLVSRSRDYSSSTHDSAAEEPAISRANGSQNRTELSAR